MGANPLRPTILPPWLGPLFVGPLREEPTQILFTILSTAWLPAERVLLAENGLDYLLFRALGLLVWRDGCGLDFEDIQDYGVVAFAIVVVAFVVHKVILGDALTPTIIAQYAGTLMLVLGGHGLIPHDTINLLKVLRHIHERVHAERALVLEGRVIVEALVMHGMAAPHEYNALRRGKQVPPTHRTVGMQSLAQAVVPLLRLERNACVAIVAVEIVDAQPLSKPAYVTSVAVIYLLPRSVLKEATVLAIPMRKAGVTIDTRWPHSLLGQTKHT